MADSQAVVWRPRVLVIGPGGIKGFSVLGFLAAIAAENYLEVVDTYCGVSVGAIIALLVVCGYQVRDIIGEAALFDIFKEAGKFSLKDAFEARGLIANTSIAGKLAELVIRKFGVVPSLHNLYLRTGKVFSAVTLNITDETSEYMDPFTAPQLSCVDATLRSINVPFIFYQLIDRGKIFVDGGLANPYPIDYFDNGITPILGVYMKSIYNQPVEAAPDTSNPESAMVYFDKIFRAAMDQRRISILQGASTQCRHVSLESQAADAVGIITTAEEKGRMIGEGYKIGTQFLREMRTGQYRGPDFGVRTHYRYPEYALILSREERNRSLPQPASENSLTENSRSP